MTIRKYRASDADAVRFICLNSDGPCNDSEDFKEFILATYCNYYIKNEPENCYVAVDKNDNPIGYILSAKDFDIFSERFLQEYPLKKEEEKLSAARESIISHEKYKKDYPAHLHIDILPEYQRQGIGRKLIDTLIEDYKNQNVKGIMLTVWKDNYNGISFYNKYGFSHIETNESTAVFGLTL